MEVEGKTSARELREKDGGANQADRLIVNRTQVVKRVIRGRYRDGSEMERRGEREEEVEGGEKDGRDG